jgi:hypothetical protein
MNTVHTREERFETGRCDMVQQWGYTLPQSDVVFVSLRFTAFFSNLGRCKYISKTNASSTHTCRCYS